MRYKVSSSYGYSYLEDGSRDERGVLVETKINGQLCSVNGIIGRIWSVKDSSSSSGGRGSGDVYGSSAILVTPDMSITVVKEDCDEVVIID